MSRYSFSFKILTNRFPFKWLGKTLIAIMQAIRETLQDFTTPLNDVYDTRFLTHSSGIQLDYWGETLNCKRIYNETDSVYLARLLVALRDLQVSLTVKAYKDVIEAVITTEPVYHPNYQDIPGWPLTWGNPLLDYRHLLIASFVIPEGVTSEQLITIAGDLDSVKLGTLTVWLVEESGGYYLIKKEIA
jgi:hypothetical protein